MSVTVCTISVLVALVSLRLLHREWLAYRNLCNSNAFVERGVLPTSMLAVRVGSELSWAQRSGIPYALVCVRIYGANLDDVVDRVIRVRRQHEALVRFDARTLVLGAWDVDVTGAVRAAARMGVALRGGDVMPVDVAIALSGADGSRVDDLIDALGERLRPLEEYVDALPLPEAGTAAQM
jgi:hypothetical protein